MPSIFPPVRLHVDDQPVACGKREKSKYRIVFKEGSDLNIFDVTEVNLSGSAHRYTTADGTLYCIHPEQVNYFEIKRYFE